MFERLTKQFLGVFFFVPQKILLSLLWSYQAFLSPFLGANCRYTQSCSNYAIDQLKNEFFLIALYRVTRRVCSCNSFSRPYGGKVITALDELADVFEKNSKSL